MAPAETQLFNKHVNLTKLLLSSLFARKQKYLIVNGNCRNKFLYTNISPERAIFYKVDIEDTLHVVNLSEKAADSLYTVFPSFRDIVACINLTELMKAMNKRLTTIKGVVPELKVVETGDVVMDIPADKTEVAKALFNGEQASDKSTVAAKVGRLIIPDLWTKYEEIVSKFVNFMKEPIERDVTISSAVGNDKCVLNKVELTDADGAGVVLELPMADGESVVSYREYLSKKKMPWKYRALIMFNDRQNVAKVMYAYKDDLCDCVCTSPGTLWFPFRR